MIFPITIPIPLSWNIRTYSLGFTLFPSNVYKHIVRLNLYIEIIIYKLKTYLIV